MIVDIVVCSNKVIGSGHGLAMSRYMMKRPIVQGRDDVSLLIVVLLFCSLLFFNHVILLLLVLFVVFSTLEG